MSRTRYPSTLASETSHILISVRGRSKSVGRGRFFGDRPSVDFDRPAEKTTENDRKSTFFRNFYEISEFFREIESISRKIWSNFGRIFGRKVDRGRVDLKRPRSRSVRSIFGDRPRTLKNTIRYGLGIFILHNGR